MRGRICLSAPSCFSGGGLSPCWVVGVPAGPWRADHPPITSAFHGAPRERWCCPEPQLAGRAGAGPRPGFLVPAPARRRGGPHRPHGPAGLRGRARAGHAPGHPRRHTGRLAADAQAGLRPRAGPGDRGHAGRGASLQGHRHRRAAVGRRGSGRAPGGDHRQGLLRRHHAGLAIEPPGDPRRLCRRDRRGPAHRLGLGAQAGDPQPARQRPGGLAALGRRQGRTARGRDRADRPRRRPRLHAGDAVQFRQALQLQQGPPRRRARSVPGGQRRAQAGRAGDGREPGRRRRGRAGPAPLRPQDRARRCPLTAC